VAELEEKRREAAADKMLRPARDKAPRPPLRAEFHQAVVQVAVRVVDGERGRDLRQMETVALVNSEAEWLDVQRRIEAAIQQIQGELDGAGS
jgi:hypothetical protein